MKKVNVPSLINKMEFCFKVSGMLHFPAFFCLHQKKEGVEENMGQPHVTLFLLKLNLNLNSLLVTRQMALFHQGVRTVGKLVP